MENRAAKPSSSSAPASRPPFGQGGGERDNRRRPGGGRRERPAEDKEFDQATIEIARVTRVMAGGKRMRFRACVIVGDRKGRIGVGLAKGQDVTAAVNKAVTKAKKHLIRVPLYKETIPHPVVAKFGAAKVMLKPAKPGTGVIAGGPIRTMMELAGVTNVVAKMLGSNNKVNAIRAGLTAFEQLQQRPEKKPAATQA